MAKDQIDLVIYIPCPVCHGTKKLDTGDYVVCNRCDEDGYVEFGKATGEITKGS